MNSRIIEDIDAQLAKIKAEGAPRPRVCAGCGQPLNPLTDSYNLVDGKPRHTTCPTSAALSNLPQISNLEPVTDAAPAELGSGAENISSEAGQPSLIYLTVEDAARLIHASKDTIRRRIRSGDLPAKRLKGGKTILLDQRDVLGLLEDVGEAA